MRLIDLHVDWLVQYVGETVVFDPAHYPGIEARRGQVEGYLQSTRAAVVSCYRQEADWAAQADPWSALGHLITRIEAEFSGRILIGPEDFDRWLDDPDGLTWAVIGVEGFDTLIRSEADLARLPRLFDRGVRLFQPVYASTSLLGGSSTPGDDRGLTRLGRSFLEALLAVAPDGPGPRPMLDLAHLNHPTSSEVLGWFEADPSRPSGVIPVYSHGAPVHDGFDSPRALPIDHAARLRALGGVIGVGVSPPFFESAHQVKSAIEAIVATPFRGRPGIEGIAIGTDFLGVSRTLPGLGNPAEVIAWARSAFDHQVARALLFENGLDLIARAVGSERRP
jgi:membrane dipeptidase